MSDLQAELFPERVELALLDEHGLDCEPPVTAMGAMVSFSDRGLTLSVADAASIEAFGPGSAVRGGYGDHSGFCQFESVVVEAVPGATPEDPSAIRLEPPKRIRTTQRRRFVRSEVGLTVPVALLIANKKGMNFLSAPGEVGNLGGGGLMMIITAHPSLVVGAQLVVAIPAPGGDPILAVSRVVQVVLDPEGPATVRLAFMSVDAVERERIERFVYRKLGGTAPSKLWASGKIISTQPSPSD